MSRYLTFLGVVLCVSAWFGLSSVPVQRSRSLAADKAGTKAPEKRRAVRVPAKRDAAVDLKRMSPAEQRIRAALDEESESGFVDTPLKEAISFLAELHGIDIILDEPALNEEGLASDEPISLDIEGITLRSALNIFLEPLQLTHVIDNEVMMITTVAKAEKRLETHVYDVSHLEEDDFDCEHLAELVERMIEAGRRRSTVWAVDVLRDGKTVDLKNGEETLRLQISLSGKPKRSFKRAPSPFITALPGCLVVRDTQHAHEQILDLLHQLARVTQVGPKQK